MSDSYHHPTFWLQPVISISLTKSISFNTLGPRQNGRHFADDTFKRIFLKENIRISIKISLKFVPKGPFDNIPALFQIMAWCRPGDKPLSEAMKVSLLTHICVARPQWVNSGAIHIIWLLYDIETFVILVTLCNGNPAVSNGITLRWVSYAQFSICYQLFQTPWSSCDVSVMHLLWIVSSIAIVCFLLRHSNIFWIWKC